MAHFWSFSGPTRKTAKTLIFDDSTTLFAVFEAPGLQKSSPKSIKNKAPSRLGLLGASWGALGALLAALGGLSGRFGALLEALEPQDGAQEAPRRLPGGTPEAKMEPQRPSNEPQEASGVQRKHRNTAGSTAAERKTPGERAERASKGPTRKQLTTSRGTRRTSDNSFNPSHPPPQGPESSLHNRQATAGTGTQLAPPPSHRRDRKTACTTAKPPASIGQQLHERLQAKLFLTPLSVVSLGRFWAWRGGVLALFFRPFSGLLSAFFTAEPWYNTWF